MTLPLSMLVNIGNGIKAKTAQSNGTPPFAYAELATLKDFCLLNRADPLAAKKRLKDAGITIDSPRKTLQQIAQEHRITPQKLYEIIYGKASGYPLPSDLPVGMAKKSLDALVHEYRFDLNRFIEHLKFFGIEATPQMTFKRLAKANDLHPAQLYYMLLASQVPEETTQNGQ
jgi:hypothetical protein